VVIAKHFVVEITAKAYYIWVVVFYKNCFLFFVIIATTVRKTTNFILFMSRNTCALRRHLRHRNRVRCHRVLLFPVHLRYSTAETRRTSLISQIPLSPPSPSYPVWNPPRCACTNAKCGVLVAPFAFSR